MTLHDRFYFKPQFSEPKIGGIEGLFFHKDLTPSQEGLVPHYLLWFHRDGVVLSAALLLYVDIWESWPRISKWFHRNNQDESLFRGVYVTQGDKLMFSVTCIAEPEVLVDYYGEYSSHGLVLDWFSHFNNVRKSAVEYNEFTP